MREATDACLAEIAKDSDFMQYIESPWARLGIAWTGALITSVRPFSKRYALRQNYYASTWNPTTLSAKIPGVNIALCGGRRMGKSSAAAHLLWKNASLFDLVTARRTATRFFRVCSSDIGTRDSFSANGSQTSSPIYCSSRNGWATKSDRSS